MSSLRRALLLLTAVGGAAAWALLDPAAVAQIKLQMKAAGPAAVVADDPNKNAGFTDAVTFPTDRKAKRSIEAAADLIKDGQWAEAGQLLQKVLESKEDIFVEVRRTEGLHWVSLRTEANRLIGSMPPAGLEFYETLFGGRAKDQLKKAKRNGDPHILAEVAQKYLHTEAGAEATGLLGTYHLDRGRFIMAALCFERLFQHEKAGKLSPITLFKAALAFNRAGDKANAAEAWKRLVKAADDGITVADRNVSVADLQQELDRFAGDELPASPYDWAMFKGNASRSAQGNGGPPFLEVKWTQPTIRESETRTWIDQAIKHQEELQQPVLPSFFPVAATVHTDKGPLPLLVYRSYWGIHALNLQKEGKEEWNSPSYWSLDNLAADPSKSMTMKQWLPQYQASSPTFLFENSTIGTLTTDNSRVYVVDDLALPPHPLAQPLQQMTWGGQASFGPLQEAVSHSRLQAYDLATGKILWELGGHAGTTSPAPAPPTPAGSTDLTELYDSYFLSPPLPLGGKLYVLTEKGSDLRLVCLDPREDKQPPLINSIQTLVHFNTKMLMDPGRRVQAAHLAYGEGILVCPTNAGVILGIDLLSHTLAWAYSYREDSPAQESHNVMGGGRVFRGGGMVVWNNGMMMGQNLSPDWKTSAPVVQNGKVVFTAPDGASVHCLNLRDGKRLWKESRADDVYLGGVYNGKVLLVGRSTCRALALADGKKLWKVETGLPSGQGVASDSIYYLPLRSVGQSKEPAVCQIDLEKGKVLVNTKSRKNEIPGNLLFYEGDVLSQTANAVTAFPQLRVRLAQIDEALKKNPRDPTGLTNRGEVKLDKGDYPGAVEDLRTALANDPPKEILPRTHIKLYETYTELFRDNFDAASEKYLDDFKKMCDVPIPPDASADERVKLREEEQRRQANYLCLLAKGREHQGRLSDAFQAYMDFGALAGNRELVTVIDEPAVKARPDVWAQGRIAAMVAKATPEQRQPLESKIREQWQTVRETQNTEGLRHFVALFGSLFTVGKEARLHLAERLMDENAFLEAELNLLQLRRQDEPLLAARAVDTLARLMIRKGLLEDAAYWYRVLGRDFPKVVVRAGKTGAELLEDLASDKRFLPYLDEPPQAWSGGKLKARESYGNSAYQQTIIYEPDGEVLPFFQRHRVTLLNGAQIRVVDRFTNEETYGENLMRNNQVNYWYNPYQNNHHAYHLKGHMMVLSLGSMVYGFDPVGHRKLWERNLFGSGVGQPNMQITQDRDGGVQAHYPDGHTRRLGQTGPVQASYVCLQTRDGLVALDPLRGTTLWTKTDVSAGVQIFGDDQHVYLVDVRADGTVGNSRALRARDGVSVDVPEFGTLYQRRLRIVGRNLLLSETNPKGSMVLRLYDVHTGQDVWKKSFLPNAMVLRSDDTDLTGVVEPANNGKVTVIDLATNEEVLTARVEPKDLEKAQEVHLLQDSQQIYLAIHRPLEAQNNPFGVNVWTNAGTMRWIQVNGEVYAFRRSTGKLNWHNAVPNLMMIVDQFHDMPILLFTAQFNRMVNPGAMRAAPQHYAAVRSIDKRTGKLLWDKDYPNNHQQFYALNMNLQAGTIDLVSYNLKIQHYLENGAGALADGGKSNLRTIDVQRRQAVPIQRIVVPAPQAPRAVP
jgi:outer membrane protein assembly factor BamB